MADSQVQVNNHNLMNFKHDNDGTCKTCIYCRKIYDNYICKINLSGIVNDTACIFKIPQNGDKNGKFERISIKQMNHIIGLMIENPIEGLELIYNIRLKSYQKLLLKKWLSEKKK